MDATYHINEVRELIERELIFTYTGKTDDHWLSALSIRINELILHNFDKLIFLLYRLDINESNLTKLLKDHSCSDAGRLIAELIIERQIQKIKIRESFRQEDINIDENEKW